MKKFKPFSIFFILIFIVQLFSIVTESESLRLITKPLICLCLMGGLYASTRLHGRFKKRIFVGLLAALAGDVFLMLSHNEMNFIIGLFAFLVCHFMYISAFHLDIKSQNGVKNPYFLWGAILFVILCISFYMYIQPKLGEMQLPVLVYCFVITLMVILAIARYGRVNIGSFRMIVVGAVFFLISDGALAYNMFVQPFTNSGVLVMSTYMIAQYLIVCGAVSRKLSKVPEA